MPSARSFRARPEIRTPTEPGLSRLPLPIGLGAREWRERESNPRRSACKAVLRSHGLPGRNARTRRRARWFPFQGVTECVRLVRFVRAGGVEPLVGRSSGGCTSVVLRACAFSRSWCQGQELHLQHTGSEPASSAGWDTLAGWLRSDSNRYCTRSRRVPSAGGWGTQPVETREANGCAWALALSL